MSKSLVSSPLLRKVILSISLSAAAAVPALVLAQEPPQGAGEMHFHGYHERSPFVAAMHQLNLTDAQKSQLHEMMHAAHGEMKQQFQSLQDARLAFDRAVPGTADFSMAQQNLLQAETTALQAHMQFEATMHTKAYAVLTDAQKAQLATILAQTPATGPGQGR